MAVYNVNVGLDVSTEFWNGRKLARQSNNTLWCCYVFFNNISGLYEIYCAYSTDEGLTWINELAAADLVRDNISPALAVDSADILHLVYSNAGADPNSRIRYRYRNAIGWSAEETITALRSGDPSIAIDSVDNIHVAYSAVHPLHNRNNVRYVSGTSGAWGAEEWVTEIFSVWGQYYVAIAIDSANNVHLAWEGTGWGLNPNNYNIQYRSRVGGLWQAQEAITDLGVSQMLPSLAIDSLDNIHLAWAPVGGAGMYQQRVGGVWQASEVIGFSNPGALNIALDRADIPYVVAENTVAGVDQLYYSRRVGGLWSAEIAVTTSLIDDYAPIAIWAQFPTIAGIGTNIPRSGLGVVFYSMAVPREINYSPVLLSWATVPGVTSDAATNIESATATLNGTLDDDGGETCQCGFEWGETSALGNTTPTQSGTTGTAFTYGLIGLTPGRTYYFRAFATNSVGTGYGGIRSFSLKVSATVMTLPATHITEHSARLHGVVIDDAGRMGEVRFQWGLTAQYGANTPWIGGHVTGDEFYADLPSLAEGTGYHFSAQFKNPAIVSGKDMVFHTLVPLGPVTLIPEDLVYLLEASV